MSAPALTALLGPTNTGKTHRALTRMLEYDTGLIGVPLRLLARELYDRLTARVGESAVALVTGEEKRVPARPRYWVCTVEAMPLDLEVEFLAIDEIQLAAHDQRGHTFTERLLHARGTRETWFLGAGTMRPLIEKLLPQARIERLPRLSQLSWAGPLPLAQLPARSAVVAFSMERVFELAERLKAKKGGAAVVLGVLSPRTRNAQVAMYQAGEVDHLVATDAIGMGLNLDVRHVAFAATRKFDGRIERELEVAELAQIAGRAGRHTTDGTFGTLAPLDLPFDVVKALEGHRFPPIEVLRWRNPHPDFRSLESLIRSLHVRAPSEGLRLDAEGEDLAALEALARFEAVQERCDSEAAVRLLWDVCRVPDYRKLLFEAHVGLLGELFVQMVDRGVVDASWAHARLVELDDEQGDIETLTARLSGIRTWAYVAHQSGWLRDATGWQQRTHALEERLSDALHARLVARFVTVQRRAVVEGRPVGPPPEPERPPEVDGNHPFAALAGLRALPVAARAGSSTSAWVERLVEARHAAFELDEKGRVAFEGRVVARLHAGTDLLHPELRPLQLESLGAGARARAVRRLNAFARDVVEELVGPLRALAPKLSPTGRGLVWSLEQTLGTVDGAGVAEQLGALTPSDRGALEGAGVVLGTRAVFLLPNLGERQLALRSLLVALHWEPELRPPLPEGAAETLGASARTDPRACLALGFLPFGRRAVRADIAEATFQALTSPNPPDDDTLARRLGCRRGDVAEVIEALLRW